MIGEEKFWTRNTLL